MLKGSSKKKLLNGRRLLTYFRTTVFSRHPSHSRLRRELPLMPFRSCIRFGSTSESQARVQANSVQGVKNSSSKLLMKKCFNNARVKTPEWFTIRRNTAFWNDGQDGCDFSRLIYPIVAKGFFGSRGVANFKLDNQAALEQFIRNKDVSGYLFEYFVKSMSREYRIHVTQEGCFYACRKLLRNGSPEDTWQMHEDCCVFILESNPSFKRPNNWSSIIEDCMKAQKALGLDINSFDVMVSVPNREGICNWSIIESQSAPSLQEVGISKYKEELPKLLRRKYESQR